MQNQSFVFILFISLFLFSECSKKIIPKDLISKDITWAASWSPDGQFIATGGNQDTLYIFSKKKYKVARKIPFKNTITKLRWHPNKNLLAISFQSETSESCILNLDTDDRIELDSFSTFGERGLGWSPDGRYLAAGDYAGQLNIYGMNGKLLRQVNTQQKAITGLDWHPSKNIITTVGEKIVIYDFDNNELTTIIPRPYEVLMLSVAWHPSGEFFVTGDYGDYIKNYPALLQFWKPNGEKIKDIEHSKAEYRNIEWSSDGKYLATASEAIRIWDKNGKLLEEAKSKHLLWGIDWSSDDKKLVTTSEIGEILIWDKNLKLLHQVEY